MAFPVCGDTADGTHVTRQHRASWQPHPAWRGLFSQEAVQCAHGVLLWRRAIYGGPSARFFLEPSTTLSVSFRSRLQDTWSSTSPIKKVLSFPSQRTRRQRLLRVLLLRLLPILHIRSTSTSPQPLRVSSHLRSLLPPLFRHLVYSPHPSYNAYLSPQLAGKASQDGERASLHTPSSISCNAHHCCEVSQ